MEDTSQSQVDGRMHEPQTNLRLWDTKAVLTPEEQRDLYGDLAELARDRRRDAAAACADKRPILGGVAIGVNNREST